MRRHSFGLFARTLPREDVGVVEILEELGEERVTVIGHGFLDPRKTLASTPSGLSPS